jgi:two-component system sensor histidine kinase DesK
LITSGGGDSSPDCDQVPFAGGLDGRRVLGVRMGGAFIWLLFILFPLINALANKGPTVRHVLAAAGAAGFVVAYVVLVITFRGRLATRFSPLLFVLLLALASTLTLAERPGWGFLFVYCSACAGVLSPRRYGFLGVVTCAGLAAATTALGGGGGGNALGFAASSAGIGLLMLLMHDLRIRNEELVAARAELARLAVAEERERFARDLHDLLGHTLSVIALKAELAGRLLPGRADEAAQEISEVEGVARNALSEVRDAVSGYRQPTLDDELDGARMALSAAGIVASVERPEVAFDPAVEAVLAWTVREGATNVIRHSHATRCGLNVSATLTDAGVEVIDDGVGAAPAGSDRARNGAGHGLAGLAERAGGVNGRLEAGARPEGGYRLAVTVPVAQA